MGCVVKKGENPKIKCELAPGKCKKLKECTDVKTLEGELTDDEIDFLSTEYANSMVEQDYIDPEDWSASYELASALLHDNSANEEELSKKIVRKPRK